MTLSPGELLAILSFLAVVAGAGFRAGREMSALRQEISWLRSDFDRERGERKELDKRVTLLELWRQTQQPLAG